MTGGVRATGAGSEQSVLESLIIQRVESKLKAIQDGLDDLREEVGTERTGENGKRIGTGLVGRIMSVEARDRTEESARTKWTSYMKGAFAAVCIVLPVVWYLTQPSLDRVFHQPVAAVSHP